MKKGFTLIELLVAVLIIGILVAIVYPHYKMAIARARIAEVLPVLRSIADANEQFYMANGYYTTNWDDLGIAQPKAYGCIGIHFLGSQYVVVYFKEECDYPGIMRIYKNSDYVKPGQFLCNGYGHSRFASKVCAGFGKLVYVRIPWLTYW